MTALNASTRALPHWVYRVYDADERVLYVGCTLDPLRRMAEQKWAHWWDDIAHIEWDSYPDYATGREAELSAILFLDPSYNRQRGSRKARIAARAARLEKAS